MQIMTVDDTPEEMGSDIHKGSIPETDSRKVHIKK